MVRGVQTDREVLGCVKMCERSPRLGVILHVKMVASNLNIFVENRVREDRGPTVSGFDQSAEAKGLSL